ncbi:MAG: aminotransferase class V-fold PLP-dependent enzyme [Candidatus Eisenbacteria bacterium]|nr:aminotransferase class V-fold PLP-dependent enzyme [Candidatus Eisenbacteria bacterium]
MRERSMLPQITLSALHREVVGCNFRYATPFGKRLLVYTDYTASGRNVRFLERYLMKIQESYANTHTEDDETGRSTTEMLHLAEKIIKREVNGDENTCVIAVGSGTTGAIQKLQEILGVYAPPALKDRLERGAEEHDRARGGGAARTFLEAWKRRAPVVFIGPYEHHSNDISWREAFAETVMIGLAPDGGMDLKDLERKVSDRRHDGRLKIGSFSAASNVTGVKTPVYEVARILHRHGALVCFDFAASAPYVEIDMNRDGDSYFDAVFLSPHKFLGGPGSSGILLFHRGVYRTDLPPTFGAGGTVDYVSAVAHDYSADIETREKSGTPGTLQVMKAALAMELKHAVGVDVIERRERTYLGRALERMKAAPNLEILGDPKPETHLAIVSFNIRHDERYLHPKLVTRLFNDLFGIQSRAGCSCAGPYGHALLGIDETSSERYRCQIHAGFQGIKPGWVRIGFHYVLDEIDFDYILRAVEFLAEKGHLFLPLYRFETATGTWTAIEEGWEEDASFGIAEALGGENALRDCLTDEKRKAEYDRYIEEAKRIAAGLEEEGPPEYRELPEEIRELGFFHVVEWE